MWKKSTSDDNQNSVEDWRKNETCRTHKTLQKWKNHLIDKFNKGSAREKQILNEEDNITYLLSCIDFVKSWHSLLAILNLTPIWLHRIIICFPIWQASIQNPHFIMPKCSKHPAIF